MILRDELQENLGCEVPFLHGGVNRKRREALVDRFQSPDGPPLFVLSLKAGGTGLNLTAATHVFHFDRWWNPAVESQATDRAFRIGQKQSVQVHKMICAGTIEDTIDQMIDQKRSIAENIVGAGESFLTELPNEALKEIFALRTSAMGG
jgi:SNF2 family DNA or RNA helicase